MTTLYLVRHGQTDWNAQHRWQGQRDVPLNAEGLRQAEAVARAFEDIAVDRVFSSDLSRARDTAALISRATGAPHAMRPSLRERAFGRWEGRTNEEIAREFPDDVTMYRKNRDTFVPPGGASWADFVGEAVEAFESLAAEYAGQRLAVVAHGGPLKAFINHVLGIRRGQSDRFILENASISSAVKKRHEITGEVWWQMTSLNITCHLARDGGGPEAART